jgi:hypothetical protein
MPWPLAAMLRRLHLCDMLRFVLAAASPIADAGGRVLASHDTAIKECQNGEH